MHWGDRHRETCRWVARTLTLLRRLRRAQQLEPVNAKRVYRLAKLHKLLLERDTGGAPMRVHEGTIAVEHSDERYCSDGFEINCDNGEKVRVTFSLDCCDREAIAFAATTAGISGELVRDVMVQTLIVTLWSGSRAAEPCRMAQRQRLGLHRPRHPRLRCRYRHDPLPNSVSLAAEQRHGRVVRQNF